MDPEIRNLLNILGFDKSLQHVPSFPEIRRQFRKECLVQHPDKTTGSTLTFQKLLSAYQKLKHLAQQDLRHIDDLQQDNRYI